MVMSCLTMARQFRGQGMMSTRWMAYSAQRGGGKREGKGVGKDATRRGEGETKGLGDLLLRDTAAEGANLARNGGIDKRLSESATSSINDEKKLLFATSDPLQHTKEHSNRMYVMNNSEDLIPLNMDRFMKTKFDLLGHNILIRDATIPVIDLIKQHDKGWLPSILLDGPRGSGKTYALSHIVDAAKAKGWYIFHVPEAYQLTHKSHALWPSAWNNGYYDQTVDAANILKQQSLTNQSILEKMVTTERYEWVHDSGPPEVCEVGTPLMQLCQTGLEENFFATDIFRVLMKEVRKQRPAPILVAIDQFNAFFHTTIIKDKDTHKELKPFRMAIISECLQFLKHSHAPMDGMVVCSTGTNFHRMWKKHLLAVDRYLYASPYLKDLDSSTLSHYKSKIDEAGGDTKGEIQKDLVSKLNNGEHTRLANEVDSKWWTLERPMFRVQIDNFSEAEVTAYLNFLDYKNYIHCSVGKPLIDYITALSDGNPREIDHAVKIL